MNRRAMERVVERKDLTSNQKLVLLIVAYHADDDGGCWPALKLLAAETGLHRVTVLRVLKELCALGALTSNERHDLCGGQLASYYRIEDAPESSAAQRRTVDKSGTPYANSVEGVTNGYPPSSAALRPPSSVPLPPPARNKDPNPDPKKDQENKDQDQDQDLRHRARDRSSAPLPPPVHKSQRSAPLRASETEYNAFYARYPRKEGKKAALKAFMRLNPDKELLARIVADVSKRYAHTETRFIPHPATYLNGRRWEDEHLPPGQAAARPLTGVAMVKDLMREREDARASSRREEKKHEQNNG